MKTKIRPCNKFYTNFCGFNMPEDGAACQSFTIISTHSLPVYENKYYLQVYLKNAVYKIVNMPMIEYLDDNPFESDENVSYK